jgi:hypothetical protein
MNKLGSFLIVAMGAITMSCASAGRQFDTTHVGDVERGVQAKVQIQEWFGPPYQIQKPLVGHPMGCVERWTYTHAFSKAGVSTTSETLVVDFDEAGMVCDHAFVTTP